MIWQFDIENVRRAGSIHIGARKNQVRERLGLKCRSFLRTAEMKNPCDYYEKEGVFVYYKDGDIVEAVEIAPPSKAKISGEDLLAMTLGEAQQLLRGIDGDLTIESDGAVSKRLGIGIYGPNGPNAGVESAIVFEDGYYDS